MLIVELPPGCKAPGLGGQRMDCTHPPGGFLRAGTQEARPAQGPGSYADGTGESLAALGRDASKPR